MAQPTRVAVDRCTLAAQVDGAEGRPWLILSNSLGADYSMWDGQMASFLQRYRVLRYDVRGHGASDRSRGAVGFADMVDDVIRLMDHFAIPRATFLGLSLGGMTGLGLALDHPDRVSRLICCAARADAPADYVRTWNERIAAVKAGGMQEVVGAIVERWLSVRTRAANPALAETIARMVCRTSPDGYIACAEALKTLDYLPRLGRIAVPTMYMAGETDPSAPPAVMQQLAERTPGARFHVVPGAAHLINCDSPAGFEQALSALSAPAH